MKSETTLKWKYELKKKLNWLFDLFKARLGHSIGESLLMTCLDQVVDLKSKWKSSGNYMKMKIWFDFFFNQNFLKSLEPTSAMA